MGTSSHCHNEDVDDVNETIDLDHDVEGLEEGPKLPRGILEDLNRGNERSKPNIEEIEVINIPKDMKDELIALLKEFKEIFAWSYQDMLRLNTEIVVHRIPVKPECPLVW